MPAVMLNISIFIYNLTYKNVYEHEPFNKEYVTQDVS